MWELIYSDSSRGASAVKADFLYLNCSKAATAGKALHGVGGGVALCGGVGPMATAVVIDHETGEEALLIEPEGQYIVKSKPMDPDFRLYSQTRFSRFKLKLRQNDDDTDVLRCAMTGTTVNLTTERGILVVETSRKDEKDLSKYVQMKQIVEDIVHGRRSPLVRIPMYVQSAESSEGVDGQEA
jgi:hypothetical protein